MAKSSSMSAALLRARRDAWTLVAWLCLGAALMLAAMPGDLGSIRVLRTLLALIALFAVAGAIVLSLGVLRRSRAAPRDVAVTLAAAAGAVLVFVTLV
jgi:hypothetical protein